MRVAVKVGYDGARFRGSQAQPNVRTVHGEVERALRQMGHDAPRLAWAGRTDAGVSAAGNVVVFETHLDAASLLAGLSFRMADAWAWASAEVGDAFEPRHASRRRYRYLLRTTLDASHVGDALRVFEGTHDFTAFCRLEPDVNPRRTVLSTDARRDGAFVVIDIVGESFLWNQVRRVVAAAERVAAGHVDQKDVEAALASGGGPGFGTADPEPLLLLDVEYDGLAFQRLDDATRATTRLRQRLEEAERRQRLLDMMRAHAEDDA